MKNHVKLLIVLLLCLASEISNAEDISRKKFEKLVDYVNCSLTENWLSNLPTEKSINSYNNIREDLLKNSIKNPVPYQKLSNLLKSNNFNGTDSTLSSIINAKKKSFNENEFLVILFDLSELSDKYQKALKEKNEILKIEIEDIYIDDPTPHSNSFLLILPALIALIFSIYIYFSFGRRLNRLSSKFSNINEHSNNYPQINGDRAEIIKLENKINYLKNVIDDVMKFSIPNIQQNIRELQDEKIVQSEIKTNDKLEIIEKQDEKTRREFFMSTPNEDGSFLACNKSDTLVSSISLYKFVVDENYANRASFSVTEDQMAIRDALSSPYKYLEPVCIIENSEYKSASKIIMKDNGVAELHGDKWVVSSKQKAKIKFI